MTDYNVQLHFNPSLEIPLLLKINQRNGEALLKSSIAARGWTNLEILQDFGSFILFMVLNLIFNKSTRRADKIDVSTNDILASNHVSQ